MKGKIGHGSKSCGNNTSDMGVALAKRGGLHCSLARACIFGKVPCIFFHWVHT